MFLIIILLKDPMITYTSAGGHLIFKFFLIIICIILAF